MQMASVLLLRCCRAALHPIHLRISRGRTRVRGCWSNRWYVVRATAAVSQCSELAFASILQQLLQARWLRASASRLHALHRNISQKKCFDECDIPYPTLPGHRSPGQLPRRAPTAAATGSLEMPHPCSPACSINTQKRRVCALKPIM